MLPLFFLDPMCRSLACALAQHPAPRAARFLKRRGPATLSAQLTPARAPPLSAADARGPLVSIYLPPPPPFRLGVEPESGRRTPALPGPASQRLPRPSI
jgi:hypothetical protein